MPAHKGQLMMRGAERRAWPRLQLGELAVGEEADAALHDVVLAHLHRAAREQLRHKQRRRQLLQVPATCEKTPRDRSGTP